MKPLLTYIVLLMSFNTIAQTPESRIKAVMQMQEACWNAGDLECFMRGYWNADELTFISADTVLYGWESTLQRFKKRYPDRAAMGELQFEIKILEPLESELWFMVGKYTVKRAGDDLSGHFSLVWREVGNEWVIVSDHTS